MATDGGFVSTWLDGAQRRSSFADHHSLAIKASAIRISAAELVFIAGIAGIIVIGWVGLALAQFGGVSRANLMLSLGPAVITAVAVAMLRRYHLPRVELTWHDATLAGILLVAAVLYTPPADYAPAFLDAGWYTNSGALIARTGALSARPAVLEELPAADRDLFIRTYHDLRASISRFPDRQDYGFYNVAFAVDLGRNGPVSPYHPPFISVWIAVLRLMGGPALGTYAPWVFGLLFVLAVYAAGRAVFGSNVALVAALLTAVSPPVVYYARTPFAELLAGALIWAGVYGITRYAVSSTEAPRLSQARSSSRAKRLAGASAQGNGHQKLRRSEGEAGRPRRSSVPLLLLAGLAFGAALLVKIESFLLLLPIGVFWLIWLRRRWATRREAACFGVPFGLLLTHAVLLDVTLLRPYVVLNVYGIGSILRSWLSQPVVWVAATAAYLVGLSVLIVKRAGVLQPAHLPPDTGAGGPLRNEHAAATTIFLIPPPSPAEALEPGSGWERGMAVAQAAVSALILFGAGAALLLAWPAMQANAPSTWTTFVTLGLFLTPLGLCLGIVGFSTLIGEDLGRRTAFLSLLLGTAGLVTVLMPAISSDVSHLYTVRRQLPIVLPALLLLTSYGVLRWAGLAEPGARLTAKSMGMRRVLVILILALLVVNFLDTGRRLTRHQELAGASGFVAQLAQEFGTDDIVLFESVDRGAHVGRFAAPLWAEHGVSAMVISSTFPPQDRLAEVIRRWQGQGRRVYFVSQSQPPPFTLPSLRWKLDNREYWAGATIAAEMSFPPESWIIEVPLYIYEAELKGN